jgi:hypothetical protein
VETAVSRSELRWVLLASLAVVLFASLPTLYAWSRADTAHVFSGFIYNTEDANSYVAKMRLGARGEWLFHLFYTPEPHQPGLVFPFHLGLGKLAAVLGLSHVLVYHLARVVLGLGLLLTVYAFVAFFTPDLIVRQLAWALVAVGSGLGWLLTLAGATNWLGSLPLDFWVPEAYAFLVLYSLPHLALAEGLLLWALLWTLRGIQEANPRWCLPAGLASFVMAWIVPFYAGVLAVALGAYLLALLVRRRQIPWRGTGLVALTGVFAVPSVGYNAWLFTANPSFATWAAQNRILSPHPLHYVLGYLLLLVPAVWGAVRAIREREARWLFPVAWVLAVPLLLYVPFNLQRRMIAVMQVPLALLAAVGLQAWLGRRERAKVAYVAVAALSNLLLVAGSVGLVSQRPPPIYLPGAEIEALQWLNTAAQEDETVLASWEVGNTIPAWTDLRVFAGHGPETLHNTEKLDALGRFFQPETDDAWRESLLEAYGIRYVFYGPEERALGGWDPSTATYLLPRYGRDGYTIFQVSGIGAP